MQALARCRRQFGNAKQGTLMRCLAFARSLDRVVPPSNESNYWLKNNLVNFN